MYKEIIKKYFEENKDGLIADIKKLVKINSEKKEAKENMPFGEGTYIALKEALNIAKEMGFKTKNYENYVGTIDFNEEEPCLDILAHLDVVPAGEGWSITDPYEPVVIDDKIYGRGSSDDKGPAICALYAMKAVKDLEIPLRKNVRLILGTDEESGSKDIEYYYNIEKEAPMTFSPDASFPVINTEKGGLQSCIYKTFEEDKAVPRIISINSGNTINVIPSKAEVVIEGASKEYIENECKKCSERTNIKFNIKEQNNNIYIEALGTSGHASSPAKANNAATGILNLLSNMEFSPSEGFNSICSLAKLFPHGDYLGESLGIAQKDNVSGELTISLDILSYDVGRLEGKFDSRCPICANDDNMKNIIEKKCKELNLDFKKSNMYPAHHVPSDSEFVRTLIKCYEEYTGKKGECVAIGGGTYVHSLKNGVAFGCSMPGTDNKIHDANEFAIVDELILSAEIFTQVIIDLCS